jgi:hypothetical protein
MKNMPDPRIVRFDRMQKWGAIAEAVLASSSQVRTYPVTKQPTHTPPRGKVRSKTQ